MRVGDENCDFNPVVIAITESKSIQQLHDYWPELGRRLNIKPITITEMRRRQSREYYSISDILSDILQLWRGEQSEGATLDELINVLEAVKFNDAVVELRKRFHLPRKEVVTYVNIGCNADLPGNNCLEHSTNTENPDNDLDNNNDDDQSDTESDNPNQPLGGIPSCHETLRLMFIQKLTRKRLLFVLTIPLLLCGIGGVIFGVIALSNEGFVTDSPTNTTSTTPTTAASTTPTTEATTTPNRTTTTSTVTTTTPEKTTVTSESTTRLPTCPYKDWYKPTCPAGVTWACWADEAKRSEENCSQWGKIYGWATLPRKWPKEDCYCCSKINCVFP